MKFQIEFKTDSKDFTMLKLPLIEQQKSNEALEQRVREREFVPRKQDKHA